MSNYRITIEPLTEEVRKNFPEELRGGVEVDGYVLLSIISEDASQIMVQHLSTLDIAKMIEANDTIRAAARLAEGLHESKKIEREGKLSEMLSKLRPFEKDD